MTTDDVPGAPLTRRRSFLRAGTATVLGAGATAGAGAGVLRALDTGGDGLGARLQLRSDSVSGVGVLETPLRDLGLVAQSPGEWLTPAFETSRVTMIGFTWKRPPTLKAPREPVIHVRLRSGDGRWGLWRPVPLLHDLPDPSTEEGRGRVGTAPLLVEPSDGLQVRVGRALPRDVRLTLIHATTLANDARVVAARRAPTLTKQGAVAPGVYSRASWGADESWRRGTPSYAETILQVHVHHTATSNGYAAADVPALIRSMYKYHTKSLGWSDIGYNFLVDSYGAIWEGRYGGIDLPVKGAHTLGFNSTSTGFSVIGNYESAAPTAATLSALSALAGWKLSLYGRDPLGYTQVTSEGSDKFGPGQVVNLPVIDGHRDTNDTACPGSYVYAQLPAIRAGTAGVIAAAAVKLKDPYKIKGDAYVGSSLKVKGGRFKPAETAVSYQWTRDGAPIEGAVAQTYVVTELDAARVVGCIVTGSLANAAPVQQGIAMATAAASIPVIAVRTQRKPGGKAIVHVEVTAPGIALADGSVLVKVGSRQRTVNVKKGKATARFLGMEPGRYRVRCQYAGGTLVLPGRGRDWIRIPGKGKNA